MLLLHLSDIHFRHGVAGTAMDPDLSLRNEILLDAEARSAELGPVDVVLVSGDIAFSGNPEEYVFARGWLENLCTKCRCKTSNVFVCPGNHDVVRSVVASNLILQALHERIRGSDDLSHEALLRGYLTNEETARILYAPLANYNLFAQTFFCDLLAPERTIARRDFRLNDGSLLRLSGFNSALLSTAADAPPRLYVDPACYQLIREPGVEHLVMCHHPFNWLRDGSRLRDHLNDLARLQLFGHEHSSRVEINRDYVRLAAGAVHPDRTEVGWEPGYNFLQVSVDGTGATRHLEVQAHVRVWQAGPGQFRAKMDRGDKPVFGNRIALDPWNAPSEPSTAAPGAETEGIAKAIEPEGVDAMNSLRSISIRFSKLTFSQKSEITGRLGLLEDQDVNQPDFERFRRAFLRARERGLVDQLDQEISKLAHDNG